MEFKETLEKVLDRESLSVVEAEAAMNSIMEGQLSESQIAGFLIALRMKGETAEEVAGFVRSMRAHVRSIEAPANAVDTCGTGGDGAGDLQRLNGRGNHRGGGGARRWPSTETVLFHPSAGARIFWRNSALWSTWGPEEAKTCLDETGFCFFFAPAYHPAMKHAVPVRRSLKVRTVFNLLGPLTNPAGVKRQVMGVYHRDRLKLVAEALALLGAEHAWVVHAEDGQDEISTTSPTIVFEIKDGSIGEQIFDFSERFGFAPAKLADLQGGDAKENAKIIKKIFSGEKSAYRDAACANAAAVIYTAGQAHDSVEGYKKAVEAVDSGTAAKKLDQIIQVSQKLKK